MIISALRDKLCVNATCPRVAVSPCKIHNSLIYLVNFHKNNLHICTQRDKTIEATERCE